MMVPWHKKCHLVISSREASNVYPGIQIPSTLITWLTCRHPDRRRVNGKALFGRCWRSPNATTGVSRVIPFDQISELALCYVRLLSLLSRGNVFDFGV